MAIEAINVKGKSSHYFKKQKKTFLSFGLVNGKIQSLFIVLCDGLEIDRRRDFLCGC